MGNKHGSRQDGNKSKVVKKRESPKGGKQNGERGKKAGGKKPPDRHIPGLDTDESSHVTGGDSESCVFHSAENVSICPYLDSQAHFEPEHSGTWSGAPLFGHSPQVLSSTDFHDGFSLEACIPPEIARMTLCSDLSSSILPPLASSSPGGIGRSEADVGSPVTDRNKPTFTPQTSRLTHAQELNKNVTLDFQPFSSTFGCHHPHFYNHNRQRTIESQSTPKPTSPQPQRRALAVTSSTPFKFLSSDDSSSAPNSPAMTRRPSKFLAIFRGSCKSDRGINGAEKHAGEIIDFSNEEKVKSKPLWKTWERSRKSKTEKPTKFSIFGTSRKSDRQAFDGDKPHLVSGETSESMCGTEANILGDKPGKCDPTDLNAESKRLNKESELKLSHCTFRSSESGDDNSSPSLSASAAASCILKLEELERSIEKTIREKFPDAELFLLRRRSKDELRGSRSLPTTPSLKKKLFIAWGDDESSTKSRETDKSNTRTFPESPVTSSVVVRRFGARTRHASISPTIRRAKEACSSTSCGKAPSPRHKPLEHTSRGAQKLPAPLPRPLSAAHKSQSQYDNVEDCPFSAHGGYQAFGESGTGTASGRPAVEGHEHGWEPVIIPTISAVFGSVSPKLKRQTGSRAPGGDQSRSDHGSEFAAKIRDPEAETSPNQCKEHQLKLNRIGQLVPEISNCAGLLVNEGGNTTWHDKSGAVNLLSGSELENSIDRFLSEAETVTAADKIAASGVRPEIGESYGPLLESVNISQHQEVTPVLITEQCLAADHAISDFDFTDTSSTYPSASISSSNSVLPTTSILETADDFKKLRALGCARDERQQNLKGEASLSSTQFSRERNDPYTVTGEAVSPQIKDSSKHYGDSLLSGHPLTDSSSDCNVRGQYLVFENVTVPNFASTDNLDQPFQFQYPIEKDKAKSVDDDKPLLRRQPVSEVISQMISLSKRQPAEPQRVSGTVSAACGARAMVAMVTEQANEQPSVGLEGKSAITTQPEKTEKDYEELQSRCQEIQTDSYTTADKSVGSCALTQQAPNCFNSDSLTAVSGWEVASGKKTRDSSQLLGRVNRNETCRITSEGSGHVPPPSPTILEQLTEELLEEDRDEKVMSSRQETEVKEFTDVICRRLSDLLSNQHTKRFATNDGSLQTAALNSGQDVGLEDTPSTKRSFILPNTSPKFSRSPASQKSHFPTSSPVQVLTIETSSSLTTTTSTDSDLDDTLHASLIIKQNELRCAEECLTKQILPSEVFCKKKVASTDRNRKPRDREYHSDDDVATGRAVPDYYDDRSLWARKESFPEHLSTAMTTVRLHERKERWLKKRRRNKTDLTKAEQCPSADGLSFLHSQKHGHKSARDVESRILTSPKYAKPILPFLGNRQAQSSAGKNENFSPTKVVESPPPSLVSMEPYETSLNTENSCYDNVKQADKNASDGCFPIIQSKPDIAVPGMEDTLMELMSVQNILWEMQSCKQPSNSETTIMPLTKENVTSIHKECHVSGNGRRSRMSTTDRTESDLDLYSEVCDDASTDSNLYADDEDDGDGLEPYAPDELELGAPCDDETCVQFRGHEKNGGESSQANIFTTCTFYNSKTGNEKRTGDVGSLAYTPSNIPAPADMNSDEEFWSGNVQLLEESIPLETAADAVSSTFQNARQQMHDIQYHLQALRRQMETMHHDLTNMPLTSTPDIFESARK